MNLSRRSFLLGSAAAVAGSATASAASSWPSPAQAASPAGDVVGKITVGYQGWFACIGDGAPINGWWHWSQNWAQPPSPTNNAIKAWPDMREYTHGVPDRVRQPGNGQPGHAVLLLRPADRRTPTSCGCSRTAATPPRCSASTRTAARARPATRWPPRCAPPRETYGRKFYIMYDVSGWTNMQSEIKTDWTSKMSAHTASSAYAHAERQAGRVHLGLRLQRRQPPLGRRRPAWTWSTGSRARAAT